jgi:hypothetical protein
MEMLSSSDMAQSSVLALAMGFRISRIGASFVVVCSK